MDHTHAKSIDKETIPIVDIAPLLDGHASQAVAQQLHYASQTLGFIYIKNHGISANCIDTARRHALQFFQSPESKKERVRVTTHHRGWLARGGAKMYDDAKADLKESFIWGRQEGLRADTISHPLRGENQWPDFVPSFEESAVEFFDQAHLLASALMRGFALGLKLPEDFFLQSDDAPLSRASFVYYPEQSEKTDGDQFGVAPHTDFGVLTVLSQDDVGGLEIKTASGEWIQAPPIQDTLIVNVGDLLSRWTDGEYKSTPHRVINRSHRERLSLVLAYDPNPETVIDANEVFAKEHHPNQPRITCGDYLSWRFDKAFAYRKQ